MKISATEEYGLRCLLQLAKKPFGQAVTGKEIAREEGLTPEYVEKILSHMTRAKLVRSIRGVKGGYVLARPAKEISLGEVLRAVSGRMISGICERFRGSERHQDERCVHMGDCGLRPVWLAIDRQLFGFLNRLALDDLLKQEGEVRLGIEGEEPKTSAPAV